MKPSTRIKVPGAARDDAAGLADGWHPSCRARSPQPSDAYSVSTARDKARIKDLSEGAEDRVLALDLDVTQHDEVEASVAAAVERFGLIDVLLNNAGYGYQSTRKKGLKAEVRAQFNANMFGLFAITRAVLPIMKGAARRANHQHHVGCRADPLPRLCLLRSLQACRGRLLGFVTCRARATWNRRDVHRARSASRRLGRPLAPSDSHPNSGLRGRGRHAARLDGTLDEPPT